MGVFPTFVINRISDRSSGSFLPRPKHRQLYSAPIEHQDTGHYCHAAMSLAQSSLDGISNTVYFQRYEQLVSNFEPAMSAMLNFLELPWSDEVLNYRQKSESRVIDTPSYQQVTRPLYADSTGRWLHLSSPMEPLKAGLSPWVEHFDYPAN